MVQLSASFHYSTAVFRVMVAGLLCLSAGCSSASDPGQSCLMETETSIGLGNDQVSFALDRKTGMLVSIFNGTKRLKIAGH